MSHFTVVNNFLNNNITIILSCFLRMTKPALPPISAGSERTRERRAQTEANRAGSGVRRLSPTRREGSAGGKRSSPKREGSAGVRKKQGKPKPKPEWDDRFSYN